MSTGLWIAVVGAAALMAARRVRRLMVRRLRGHTLRWRVTVGCDGRLTARSWRLRLYGLVVPDHDAAATAAMLRAALADTPVRLRVVAIDRDGTLAVILRCDGRNQAVELLRCGAAATQGTGARRYRLAQRAAQQRQCGFWRSVDHVVPEAMASAERAPSIVRWWRQ